MREIQIHKFSFELVEKIDIDERNRLETFTRLDKERQLLAAAEASGVEMVRLYCRTFQTRANQLSHRSNEENLAKVVFEAQTETFKKFCNDVQHHDWFYGYSDDQKVWRRGEDREQELVALVKANGGIYLTIWNHFAVSHRRLPMTLGA